MYIKITKHCHKRILERARILEEKERTKLIREIVEEGDIIDIRGRNILIKYNEHYLIIRLTNKKPVAISYIFKVIPRGFNQRWESRIKLRELIEEKLDINRVKLQN